MKSTSSTKKRPRTRTTDASTASESESDSASASSCTSESESESEAPAASTKTKTKTKAKAKKKSNPRTGGTRSKRQKVEVDDDDDDDDDERADTSRLTTGSYRLYSTQTPSLQSVLGTTGPGDDNDNDNDREPDYAALFAKICSLQEEEEAQKAKNEGKDSEETKKEKKKRRKKGECAARMFLRLPSPSSGDAPGPVHGHGSLRSTRYPAFIDPMDDDPFDVDITNVQLLKSGTLPQPKTQSQSQPKSKSNAKPKPKSKGKGGVIKGKLSIHLTCGISSATGEVKVRAEPVWVGGGSGERVEAIYEGNLRFSVRFGSMYYTSGMGRGSKVEFGFWAVRDCGAGVTEGSEDGDV
ncbi:hypothetical protein H0H92_007409 [Tricholoma furcatifolium]|nr:hypothetical protein H0H92_007409 [Tricholoma furcatifolium]